MCDRSRTYPDNPGNTAVTVALMATVWPDIGVAVPVPWMVEIGVMIDREQSPPGVAYVEELLPVESW